MAEQQAGAQTAEMLEEMIRSTHHLDEILQRMCAIDSQGPEQANNHDKSNDSSEESDVEFEDCVDDTPIEEDEEVTPDLYSETVRKAFRGAGGGKIEIPAAVVDFEKLLGSTGGDLAIRFASCTRDTSFTFPSSIPTPSRGDFEVISSQPSESNVSYSYFISRLRQQIVTCDHIVPVERADEAAQLAFLLLEEQQRRLLGAISNQFPYQRESVYWVQSNRVCEVFIQEAEHDNQWGLQLKLHMTSHLRARVDTDDSSQQNLSNSSDPGLSSCTRCRVFLPKTSYLDSPGKAIAFQTSIAVELALQVSEKEKANSEASARENFEGQPPAKAHVKSLDSTELPEMLTVSLWGSHDENPVLDNQNSAQPVNRTSIFKKVEIETAIAFTSGSFLARSMSKLYRDSIAHEDKTGIAGADLVLVVSGQRLPAHKLLLAQRSPVLRELILDEEQQQQNRLTTSESDKFGTETTELLLPTLRLDVARLLLEFIYTDNFTLEVSKNSYYLVHDVLRAAKLYKLPSLVLLCRQRLFSASPSSLFGSPPEIEIADDELSDTSSEEDEDESEALDRSTRTLNDDMKFALSDDVWADTVLIAEGRRIPVHRCMLIARSEYFRAVLAFHRLAENEVTERKMAVVNVEDSYAGIVRVLRFIYYDQVALPQLKRTGETDAEVSDQLLEDLVAADKYGLERMKRLCEHAIGVTAANCLEVLVVAELVHAAHLKQVAMRFVQTNLADVTARREEFQRFQEDFPQLLEELYASLRDASRDEFLLREWHREVGTSLAAQREEQELQWGKKSDTTTFPWVPLSLTLAFGTMYLSMMHAQEHEYSAVPATNLVAIAAIGGAIMMGYL
ncbi:hypothetical protein JG688_00002184 [Phytophthora aleatoria]|uniref:BTB domain-containing protein n=1 Tax=Phytophthora aleatoria TaxID=2496075 RepID=A0A8J5IUZ0_9STRA|nr:hypothetical protein JG688_00002184 [Phytophthora aleatoria]